MPIVTIVEKSELLKTLSEEREERTYGIGDMSAASDVIDSMLGT